MGSLEIRLNRHGDQWIRVKRDGSPDCLIHCIDGDNGFIVDVWAPEEEGSNEPIATMWAFNGDLSPEVPAYTVGDTVVLPMGLHEVVLGSPHPGVAAEKHEAVMTRGMQVDVAYTPETVESMILEGWVAHPIAGATTDEMAAKYAALRTTYLDLYTDAPPKCMLCGGLHMPDEPHKEES